uniref:Yip1 domain-containing protein n=1 Tax=Archaeoglobus fulgidus TaxID=2234 RepID=A0A7J2THP5_ARCFL
MLSIIPRDLIYSNLIINIAVTAWSLTIWSFALRHARELELREAFICASMPAMLFAVYQVWSILKLL